MIGRAWARVTRTWKDAARIIAEEQALALTKPPAPGDKLPPGAGPEPGAGLLPPVPGPAPGPHHRGHHMVIDTWECGCIYTWTAEAGWAQDFDCLDEKIRRLLTS